MLCPILQWIQYFGVWGCGSDETNYLKVSPWAVMDMFLLFSDILDNDKLTDSLHRRGKFRHPVIYPKCLFFSVIKIRVYLHFAYCTTLTSPFCSVGRLLSLRENPFCNCCRPPPHRSTLIILEAEERESREGNAGWGPTTGTRCSTTSGLNQSSGASVRMEQRGCAVGSPRQHD